MGSSDNVSQTGRVAVNNPAPYSEPPSNAHVALIGLQGFFYSRIYFRRSG